MYNFNFLDHEITLILSRINKNYPEITKNYKELPKITMELCIN